MKTQPLRLKLREATRNAILEAAEQVAAREGSGSASLQAIAADAGTAVGTIYNYFADRQKLFDALFELRREELYAAIDDAAKKHARDAFAAQLDAFVRAVFTYFDDRRSFLRIALEAEPSRTLVKTEKGNGKQPAMQQLQERAERVVRIGVREKKLRQDDANLLATVLVSIVKGVLIMRAEHPEPFGPQTERVVSLFLDGAAK
jgi:AcrR family transcriptional regulator